MSAEPLVSVIIPTYNRAGVVCETVENILQQTYSNIEIVVVDDGSTDDTQSRLRSYGRRVQLVAQKNTGPAAARNRGIAISKGEIIAFQDSDDTWHPTKIERQVSLLSRAGESVPCCLCNSEVQLHDGRVIHSFDRVIVDPPIQEGIWLNVPEVLATRFILFNQAVAIRREVLERIGGFDESFRILEDVEMQLRLSLEGPWAIIRDPLATRQEKFACSLSNEESQETACQYEVRARESILKRITNERFDGVRPLMERELRIARRHLLAARLKGKRSFGASALSSGLNLTQRFRDAVYRRTPWYPKMKVAPVESPQTWDSARQQHCELLRR
jgi:glycosyltransferase involved in cell wall biosynthesis